MTLIEFTTGRDEAESQPVRVPGSPPSPHPITPHQSLSVSASRVRSLLSLAGLSTSRYDTYRVDPSSHQERRLAAFGSFVSDREHRRAQQRKAEADLESESWASPEHEDDERASSESVSQSSTPVLDDDDSGVGARITFDGPHHVLSLVCVNRDAATEPGVRPRALPVPRFFSRKLADGSARGELPKEEDGDHDDDTEPIQDNMRDRIRESASILTSNSPIDNLHVLVEARDKAPTTPVIPVRVAFDVSEVGLSSNASELLDVGDSLPSPAIKSPFSKLFQSTSHSSRRLKRPDSSLRRRKHSKALPGPLRYPSSADELADSWAVSSQLALRRNACGPCARVSVLGLLAVACLLPLLLLLRYNADSPVSFDFGLGSTQQLAALLLVFRWGLACLLFSLYVLGVLNYLFQSDPIYMFLAHVQLLPALPWIVAVVPASVANSDSLADSEELHMPLFVALLSWAVSLALALAGLWCVRAARVQHVWHARLSSKAAVAVLVALGVVLAVLALALAPLTAGLDSYSAFTTWLGLPAVLSTVSLLLYPWRGFIAPQLARVHAAASSRSRRRSIWKSFWALFAQHTLFSASLWYAWASTTFLDSYFVASAVLQLLAALVAFGVQLQDLVAAAYVLAWTVKRHARAYERQQTHLVRQVEQAQQAEKAQGMFLAVIGHEIRTPIHGIIGMSDLLQATALSADQADLTHGIEASANALSSMVNDLLELSKAEADMIELENMEFCVPDLVEEVVHLVAAGSQRRERRAMRRSNSNNNNNNNIENGDGDSGGGDAGPTEDPPIGVGVELICDVGDNVPPFVYGDPGRVRQVILNLVSNAIKFSPQGSAVVARVRLVRSKSHAGAESSPKLSDGLVQGRLTAPSVMAMSSDVDDPISASTSRVDPRNDRVLLEFSVHDSGIGMSPAQLGHVFLPFAQATASTSRKFGGTGLGLSICTRLVQLMGGALTVSTRPGHGSVFRFRLPLKVPATEAPANQSTKSMRPHAGSVVNSPSQAPSDSRSPRNSFKLEDLQALERARVFIIDDSALNCTVLQRTFRPYVHRRVTAETNPDLAVSRLRSAAETAVQAQRPSDAFNVVLVDYEMPGVFGTEVVIRLRDSPVINQPDLLIFLLYPVQTPTSSEVRHLLATGLLDGVLPKPLRRSVLLRTVAEHLRADRSHSACASFTCAETRGQTRDDIAQMRRRRKNSIARPSSAGTSVPAPSSHASSSRRVTRQLSLLQDDDEVLTVRSTPPHPTAGSSLSRALVSKLSGSNTVRVLFADDHPVNRSLVSRILLAKATQLRYDLTVVENGQLAVDAFDRQARQVEETGSTSDFFHIVLMDCVMPVLDGIEATLQIRQRERAMHGALQARQVAVPRRVAIVGLSGNALDEDRRRCLDHGMDEYMVKPFKPAQLRELLSSIVADRFTPLDRAARRMLGDRTPDRSVEDVAALARTHERSHSDLPNSVFGSPIHSVSRSALSPDASGRELSASIKLATSTTAGVQAEETD